MHQQSVFITGISTGLGKALALAYLAKGYRVGGCARRLELLSELKDKGVDIYVCDVMERDVLRSAIEDFSRNEELDLVIANAGVSQAVKKQVPDLDDCTKVFNINVIGVMNTFAVATEIMMKQERGHLAAVSSIAGLVGLPGVSAYSASKAAVIKMCETLGIDLRPFGIVVSCICPGFIDTPLTQKNPHPMPALMSADRAAQIVMRGLEKKKSEIYFPFSTSSLVRLLALLPRPWYQWLMRAKSLNYSVKHKD